MAKYVPHLVTEDVLEIALPNYLGSYDLVGAVYSENNARIINIADYLLDERTHIQEQLDTDPSVFDDATLESIKAADQFILDNIDNAIKWLYGFRHQVTEPKHHWWWYLPEIKAGVMTKPDLDTIFSSYAQTVA